MNEEVNSEVDDFEIEICDGNVACPVCQEPMKVQKMYRVAVDVCDEHGVWLDKGELKEIKKSIKRSHRKSMKLTRDIAKKQGRREGVQWGWWSLFWD